MTRLNPQTTPRHQLRAEKARRNKEAALNAFIGKKAEIDEMLARLTSLSDDHFNAQALIGTSPRSSCHKAFPQADERVHARARSAGHH